MHSLDYAYTNLIERIVAKSECANKREDRTGVGSYSLFSEVLEFDLSLGFPLMTCKFTSFKMMATEWMFFTRGITNNNWLTERGCNIWKPWANEDGELGPIYGAQLRNFNGFDQLQYVVDTLKANPDSRRIMFTYYNPSVIPDEKKTHKENIDSGKAVLPPCHVLYVFSTEVRSDGKRYLNGHLTQRSGDVLLGIPFNISQLALWVEVLAHHCDLIPGKISHMIVDAHIYDNQLDDAKAFLLNVDYQNLQQAPTLKIIADRDKPIDEYELSDFELSKYDHQGKFKFDIAV